jgi:ankyrin repeat protein
MATKTKLNIFKIMGLTPEEATKMLWGELKRERPDLQFIKDIIVYSPMSINCNVQNELGRTALMHAARFESEKSVELLLSYGGIDVNRQDKWGRTALMLAARYGKEKSIGLLLKHPKIDVNVQNEDGETALIAAVRWGKEKAVELLLKHPGNDRTLKNKDFDTAWNLATDSIRHKFPKLFPNS